jgi:hypothetical protein
MGLQAQEVPKPAAEPGQGVGRQLREWMANARRPPVERQGVVPGGVPATHCNGAQSVVVPDSAEGPFDVKL